MKKIFIFFIVINFSLISLAQKNISGIWQGILTAGGGIEVHLVFNIKDSAGVYSVTMDSPDQGVKGIPASINTTGDSILITAGKGAAKYMGLIKNDSTIYGTWLQGASYPLNIKKVKEIEMARRPQTPKAPFPYRSQDVIYFNKDKSIQYGATITIPEGKGPFPSLLLLTGSGQTNRDEEMLQHRPFAVIADYLTKKGYIVMRVDDRGVGQTTGDLKNATTRDFATDGEVSFDYLKNINEVDKKHMGLLGHSEGGMIAQIIAAERSDIDFIVSLAGPGEKVTTLMEEQNEALLRINGIPESIIKGYVSFYKDLLPTIINAHDLEDAKTSVSKLLDNWISKSDKNTVILTTGINGPGTKEKYINVLLSQMYLPWYLYFIKYDPDIYLQKIHSKILALDGDKDIQVIAKSNLSSMETSLKKGPSKNITFLELKGLNHLFQHCNTCTPQEYGKLEETIAPEALETISNWLKMNVYKAK